MLCAVDPVVCLNFIGFVVQIVSIIGCHRIYASKGRKGGAFVGFSLGPLGFVLACLVKPVKRDPRLDGIQINKAIKQPISRIVLLVLGLILSCIWYCLLGGVESRSVENFLGFLLLAGLAILVMGIICRTVAAVRQTSRRRADAGNPQCQYNVAVAILNGEGNVFKTLDTSLAIGYLKRSAEQGYQPAIAAIEEIRERGVDVGFVAHARVCNAPINPETGASLTEDELEKRRADGHPVDRCHQELTDEDVFCPACGAEISSAKGSTVQVDAQSVVPRKQAVSWSLVAACIMLFLCGGRWFVNYQKEKVQKNLDGLLNFNKRQTDEFLNSYYERHSNEMAALKDAADFFNQRKQREWAEKATEIMGFKVTQMEVESLSHSELRKVLEALVRCENAFQKIDEEMREYYREQQHGSSRYTDYLDGLEASLKTLDQAIESFLATKAPVSHGSMTVTQTTNRLEQGWIDVARSELKQFGAAVRICRKNLESDLATDSSVTDEILADPDYKAGMTDESRQTFVQNWVKVCKAVDYNPLAGE